MTENIQVKPAPEAPAKSALFGVKVLLMGPTGTGKTHSLGTFIDTPIKRAVYFAFEQGTESLIGYYTDRGLPVPEKLKICTVRSATASWTDMASSVKNVNTLTYEMLKKSLDAGRSKYDQLEKFLASFNNVVTDAGEKLGPVDSWGPDTALFIDGLTGLGDSAMKAVIGGKFDKDQKDWGLAQNMVEGFLRRLCDNCRCHAVVLSHLEREPDPLGGVSKLTVSTLGAKLAPKIPPMFSDVILTVRNGREWFWDTENPLADLKTRNLPIGSKLPPSFGVIIDKWQSRGGVL